MQIPIANGEMACPQSSGFPLHKAGSIGISWEFVRNAMLLPHPRPNAVGVGPAA